MRGLSPLRKVRALQHGQVHVAVGILERDLHILVEELGVALPHGVQQLHVLHRAVHHRAAVGRDDAVGEVEAALDGALEQGAAGLAEEVRHIIGRDVHGAGVGRGEADGNAVAQVQQGFGDVFAGVGDADLAVAFRLGHKRVVRLLQQVLEVNQMLQVSHLIPLFKKVPVIRKNLPVYKSTCLQFNNGAGQNQVCADLPPEFYRICQFFKSVLCKATGAVFGQIEKKCPAAPVGDAGIGKAARQSSDTRIRTGLWSESAKPRSSVSTSRTVTFGETRKPSIR